MKLSWWMREVPCAGRGTEAVFAFRGTEAVFAFRVHPLYRWWLYALAVWAVLRAVRIEVGFRVRGDDP